MNRIQPKSQLSVVYGWVAVPLIIVCWFSIEHTWESSVYFFEVSGAYDGTENRTADSLGYVNPGSATARIVLASFGILGLIIPSHSRLALRKPMLWTMVAYLGWLVCTLLWSIDPAVTLYKLTVLSTFVLAALGIARQLEARQLIVMFGLTCLGFILMGVVAENSLGTFDPSADGYRFTGTAHANTQSIYAATICLMATLLFKQHQKLSLLMLGCLLLVVGIGFLLLTRSRTTLASTLLAMIAIQGLRSRGKQRIMLVLGGTTLLITGALVIFLLGGSAKETLGGAASMGRTESMATLSGRVPLWEELLVACSERPILGYGYLAFWDADRVDDLSDQFRWEIPHGHNVYIDIMLDGGIVALMLFLALLLTAMISSARAYRTTSDEGYAIVFGMVWFILLHGTAESLMKLPTFSAFIFVTLVSRLVWDARVRTPRAAVADTATVAAAERVGASP
ncbi:MAG: O-antigen ligase family protein [Planctomycetota bacterium]